MRRKQHHRVHVGSVALSSEKGRAGEWKEPGRGHGQRAEGRLPASVTQPSGNCDLTGKEGMGPRARGASHLLCALTTKAKETKSPLSLPGTCGQTKKQRWQAKAGRDRRQKSVDTEELQRFAESSWETQLRSSSN